MPKDRDKRITLDAQGRILLFGQPVGTIRNKTAVVDSSCQLLEMNRFLLSRCKSVTFKPGVASKLAEQELHAKAHTIHRARVYQLRPDVNPMLRFTGYQELIARFGAADSSHYTMVFDGDVSSSNPERVYQQLRDNPPQGYKGHPLTRSDVLEVYNPVNSQFFYIDTFALQPIPFDRNLLKKGDVSYEQKADQDHASPERGSDPHHTAGPDGTTPAHGLGYPNPSDEQRQSHGLCQHEY